MANLEVFQIPALEDNYIYVLKDHDTGQTVVIDPALAAPVLAFLNHKGWPLSFIWNTHHHPDHVGGNMELKQATGCRIFAFSEDLHRIPGWDRTVEDGEKFDFAHTEIQVKHVPGHTLGHIAFFIPEKKWLFCGDTLFAMGCGRLFEGTPEQMWRSLQWIKSLPLDTQIFCTHEYTLANARFAQTVDPRNQRLRDRMDEVRERRRLNQSTVPFVLEEELATNPFLRTGEESLRESLGVGGVGEIQVFARLRQMKDRFKTP